MGKVKNSKRKNANENEEEDEVLGSSKKAKAREHMDQLQKLREKDPEFYEFLKEHDKELLQFNDEDIDDDNEFDVEDAEMQEDDIYANEMEDLSTSANMDGKPSKKVITTAMVDSWITSIHENTSLGAVRSIMRAFRTACHHGDDGEDESAVKFSIISSGVFNKIMMFVLGEMDGILRGLLKLPSTGGKKETIDDLMTTKQWKHHSQLVKSYLGNALHVLNQMTDTEMISFTLRRLRYSCIFLAAFPTLLRKYIKVILHFWGTGGGALPVVSFLFLRDLCIRIGSDCLDDCFKGIYKNYVMNCHFVNATKLEHIQFLGNCVIELLGVDLPTAYQHAFVFIRQLAMILREALNTKTKEAFRKVYEWKFINCLELWTGAVCTYNSEPDFHPPAYPLTQIITGVARLVPTAQYFPLRLRCARMLNRIAASTDTFIPVSILLLDMLEMKELHRPATGGVGRAVDLRTILKVNKPTLKTRAFQEACVFSVVEEVAEHLEQWSYSVAFFEFSATASFAKLTNIDRFRREVRELIRQIDANSEFTNEKRMSSSLLPSDPEATAFLEAEKKSGQSPLSQYIAAIRQRAQQRNESVAGSSVIVGEHSSAFKKGVSQSDEEAEDGDGDDDDGAAETTKKRKKEKKDRIEEVAADEDVVEDLVLSSDEYEDADEDDEEDISDIPSDGNDVEKPKPPKQQSQQLQKPPKGQHKKLKPTMDATSKKRAPCGAKSKKRKRANKRDT
ncbi:Nucleolar complex protein 2 [Dillenia turbinata]|uniref:Nucleolar complex protein 2 n=1 Tax=Dillenia turbinata TaxID=194707 RepID=A0AAN8Z5L0_9MAGN